MNWGGGMMCCAVRAVRSRLCWARPRDTYPSHPDPCLSASPSEMIKLMLDFEANNDNRLSLLDITKSCVVLSDRFHSL
ncbi:hypothetical protein K456DRAFT_1671309 [Colletotrichum gloeosporioides 23]|nr:hypothetical protein K456DRAFT_1671309 [Colletotrichum gloeosporioides 23]